MDTAAKFARSLNPKAQMVEVAQPTTEEMEDRIRRGAAAASNIDKKWMDIPWQERNVLSKIGYVCYLVLGLAFVVALYWFLGSAAISFLDKIFSWHIAATLGQVDWWHYLQGLLKLIPVYVVYALSRTLLKGYFKVSRWWHAILAMVMAALILNGLLTTWQVWYGFLTKR